MKLTIAIALLAALVGCRMIGQDPPAKPVPQEEPKGQAGGLTLEQFAQSVQKRTGKTFIYNPATGALMRETRIQFVSSRDTRDKDKLLALFQNFLQVQPTRLVLVEAGTDTYKILTEAEARRAGE